MKKSLTFLLIGVLAVLSLTFAAYIVLTQFKPEREIRKMMITMAHLQSVHHELGFTWTQQDEYNPVTTILHTNGSMEVADDLQINHTTDFGVVYFSKQTGYQELSGEFRTIDEGSYLTYAPPGPRIQGVDFDDHTWIAIDQSERSLWGPLLPGVTWPIESIFSKDEWTPEGRARLQYLLSYADIVDVTYNGYEFGHDGEKIYRISAWLSAQPINSFLLDLVRAKDAREPSNEERLLAYSTAKQLSGLSVNVWIGENNHFLYALSVDGTLRGETQTQEIPIDFRIEFSQFNEDLFLEIPTTFLEFKDLFEAVYGVLPSSAIGSANQMQTLVDASSARLPVTDEQTNDDPDEDGLTNIVEAFYGTNALVADTDMDGMNDGDEVRMGRNPRGIGGLFEFGL
jgi:hypothetical protein